MVLQSIVIYSALIFFMMVTAKLYGLERKFQLTDSHSGFTNHDNLVLLILPILAFSVVMGIRYDVGTDFFSYQRGYIMNFDVGKGEFIFPLISQIFNKIGLHYSIYFTFLAFLNITFFLCAFKRDYFVLPFLILFLFTNGDWLYWMNAIRQALATCIWIYALKFIEKRKVWKYLIFCVVAIGFHNSAIILILFYPILRNGKDYFRSIKLQFVLLIGAIIAQLTFSKFLMNIEPIVNFYQTKLTGGIYDYSIDRFRDEAIAGDGGTGVAYLFRLVFNFIIIFYSVKLKSFYNSKWFTIIYFLFFIGIIAKNIFPPGTIVLSRPFRYFYVFNGVMYAYFIYYLIKSKNTYNGLLAALLVIVSILAFYFYIGTANANSHIWYQTYFNHRL